MTTKPLIKIPSDIIKNPAGTYAVFVNNECISDGWKTLPMANMDRIAKCRIVSKEVNGRTIRKAVGLPHFERTCRTELDMDTNRVVKAFRIMGTSEYLHMRELNRRYNEILKETYDTEPVI